jgi:hypothetical protein
MGADSATDSGLDSGLVLSPVVLGDGWFAGDPNDSHQPGVTIGTLAGGFAPITERSTPGVDGFYVLGQAQSVPVSGQLYTCTVQIQPGTIDSIFLQVQGYAGTANIATFTLDDSGAPVSPPGCAGCTASMTYQAPTYTLTVTAPFPPAGPKDAGGDGIPYFLAIGASSSAYVSGVAFSIGAVSCNPS